MWLVEKIIYSGRVAYIVSFRPVRGVMEILQCGCVVCRLVIDSLEICITLPNLIRVRLKHARILLLPF